MAGASSYNRVGIDMQWIRQLLHNEDSNDHLRLILPCNYLGSKKSMIHDMELHIGDRDLDIPEHFRARVQAGDVGGNLGNISGAWEVNLWFDYSESRLF